MVLSMRVVIAVVLIWAFAGLGQSAYALGKHKVKKNANPYAYLAPKKQKKATGGWYQSPVSGQLVYGKKKK